MELFHNQVTKGAGGGLDAVPAQIVRTVLSSRRTSKRRPQCLDFPTRAQFIRELSKGYDVVGISFIAPNVTKAQEMARLVRKASALGAHRARWPRRRD